jgi:hypothetical protein
MRCCGWVRSGNDDDSRDAGDRDFITQGRLAEAAVMLAPDALFESAIRTLENAVSRFERSPGVGAASSLAPLKLIH